MCRVITCNYERSLPQTGYIDGVTEPVDSPGVGGSVVLEPNLVKRAIVRINATAKAPDGTTVEFPPELIDSVKLVDDDGNESPYADPESGRQRTAAEDRLPSTSGCANSGNAACFDFYADPGSKFRGRADTSPSTKYLFAQSPLTEKETEIGKQVGGKTTVAITFVPAPPDAPTSVSATAGVRQATVSWTAPTSVGFSAIEGYKVEQSVDAGVTWVDSTCIPALTPASTSCVASDLSNGTAYTFQVSATNAVGTGDLSLASDSVTTWDVPDAPDQPYAEVASSTTVTVTWLAPANNGSAIEGYKVEQSVDAGVTWVDSTCIPALTPASTSCVASDLSNGTAYTFQVSATNAVGTGDLSLASDSVTTWDVPDAPDQPYAEVASSTTVTVTWLAPANNGSAIEGYKVEQSVDAGVTWVDSTCIPALTPASTSCVASDLSNGTAYTFQVSATNAVGTGDLSLASDSVTTTT